MTANVRTDRRARALALLAGGASAAHTARQLDMSERTIRRWLAEPAFAAQVAQVRGELLGQVLGQLADASTRAVATLLSMLDADSEHARVSAARVLLASSLAYRDALSIEERLSQLEAHMPVPGR